MVLADSAQSAEWTGVAVAVAGIFVSVLASTITSVRVAGRREGAAVTGEKLDAVVKILKDELQVAIKDVKEDLGDQIKATGRDAGTAIESIRSRVSEIDSDIQKKELWGRDNFIRTEAFDRVEATVDRLSAKVDQYSALQVKVDTMWQFQIRRSMSEAVGDDLGTMKSPLTFNDDALAAMEPLRADLVAFYAGLPEGTSDSTALVEIEQKFGSRLMEEVAAPRRMPHGACLLLAYAVAKQTNSVDIQFEAALISSD